MLFLTAQIIPGLYLGSVVSAMMAKYLIECDIVAVLNVSGKRLKVQPS
jgi:hypothetical protein